MEDPTTLEACDVRIAEFREALRTCWERHMATVPRWDRNERLDEDEAHERYTVRRKAQEAAHREELDLTRALDETEKLREVFARPPRKGRVFFVSAMRGEGENTEAVLCSTPFVRPLDAIRAVYAVKQRVKDIRRVPYDTRWGICAAKRTAKTLGIAP